MPAELLPHLRRARDVADRDFAEPLDLGALAANAGVSEFHFGRVVPALSLWVPPRLGRRARRHCVFCGSR
ncbi:hypothetical protein JOE26_000688 [Rhodococcus coprophilus]|uniref:Transcriptional regulator n=1 Tax=Rhodococcus coprophilus TaxID=38310 RepID=A0A2X4U915_9NOCA|nr:hypothetical protein [Rhodococcus coprophilus]SQI30882.1 transcriptional regulator [Rhodococcus coprophilus]